VIFYTKDTELSIGSLIKSARKEMGYTRKEFAEITDINENSLVKYERAGEEHGQYPPLPVLARIITQLEIDPVSVFEEALLEWEKANSYPVMDEFYEFIEKKSRVRAQGLNRLLHSFDSYDFRITPTQIDFSLRANLTSKDSQQIIQGFLERSRFGGSKDSLMTVDEDRIKSVENAVLQNDQRELTAFDSTAPIAPPGEDELWNMGCTGNHDCDLSKYHNYQEESGPDDDPDRFKP